MKTHVPTRLFLTKGGGVHEEKLTSFEMALRNAGIASFNLVRVSSIIPPGCKIVSKEKGLKELSPGQIVYCVMSENATNEHHRLIAASIGVAIPANKSKHGYLSEYHSFGDTEQIAGDYAEDLAAYMLATTLGLEADKSLTYDKQLDLWKASGQIIRTINITQSAMGKRNLWTTVIAAAIFI